MDKLKSIGCPQLRRDELLNFATIMSILKNTHEKDEIAVIDALKQQAKAAGISLRDMQSLIKKVRTELSKQSAPVISAPATTALPEEFQTSAFNPCGYEISESGIYTYIGEHIIQVCPHPIFPVEILRNIDSGNEKIRIAFLRKGVWKSDIVVDRIDISSGARIIKLANYGIMVNDENARYLIKYLCDIEVNNEQLIKPINATSHLGYTKYGFVPYADNVVYDLSNGDNKRRFDLYRECGSYEVWREMQIKCCEYVIPRIVIAAGYASLLLEKFGLNPFGVHLWGDTGKGKSVAIMASASIYGYPSITDGIVYTGNATSNGLEPRLSFVRNCCFYLDELSLLSPKQIDNMIMLTMQGQGKMRMARTGNARESYYWNCVMVTNAEMPVTNDFAKGGVFNRIIQLCPDKTVFGDMDLPEIAETFKKNYGFGAKRFIEVLETPTCLEILADLRKKYYSEIIPFTEDKQANAASLLLVAYELANTYIYHDAAPLTPEDIIPFVHSRNEISQVMRVYDKFIDWVQANYKFFDTSDIGYGQQKYGQLTNRDGDEYVDIFPHRLDEFMRDIVQNMPTSQFLAGLRDRELLKTSPGKLQFTARINNKVQRIYAIRLTCNTSKVLHKGVTEQLKFENLIPIDDEDLPF